MGSGFSEEAPGGENEKIVKKWLIDCGLCESDFELHQSKGIIEALLDSVIKKKNAKGAIGASTNANIRSMVDVLVYWKERYPGKPLTNQIKGHLLRLFCFNCLLLNHTCFANLLFFSGVLRD